MDSQNLQPNLQVYKQVEEVKTICEFAFFPM